MFNVVQKILNSSWFTTFSPPSVLLSRGKYFFVAHFLFPSNNSNVEVGMEEKKDNWKKGVALYIKETF